VLLSNTGVVDKALSDDNLKVPVNFVRLMLSLIFLNTAYLPIRIARKHFKGDSFSVYHRDLNLPMSSTLLYRQIVLIIPRIFFVDILY